MKVWTSAPATVQLGSVMPFSSGCARVPLSGYIGTDVYAQTSAYSASNWDWSESSSYEPFHWYVFSSGGTILDNAHSDGDGGATVVSTGSRYWKVENLGALPQAWEVCWD